MLRFKCLVFVTRRASSIANKSLVNSFDAPNLQQSYFCSSQAFTQKTVTNVPELPEPVENNTREAVPRLKSLEPGSAANFNLSDFGSAALPSYNFAAYADKSPVLQQFINLGVELYKFENNPTIGEFLLTLNFEKDVKPYLIFLKDVGVHPDNFGAVITKNPFLFKEKLEDLLVRINYLQSKKFTQEMISGMLVKYPKWLSMPVKLVDQRLGILQNLLKLKGDEVRSIISRRPSLISSDKKKFSTQIFVLKEDMQLDEDSVRQMCVNNPGLLRISGYEICRVYDYLTKEMNVSRDLIIKQPYVFSCRQFILRRRHMFLKSLGRAQYNPKLPGYVSLVDLVRTNDEEFCSSIAKTDLKLFYEFLKIM